MKLTAKNAPPAKVTWGIISSPAGRLAVGLTGKGEICRIAFLRNHKPQEAVAEWHAEWPKTQFVMCASSDSRFKEKRKGFPSQRSRTGGAKLGKFSESPVALVGTKFQQSVWRVMAKIPSGSVTTYGEIARYIGNPKASRAVGAACGANPVPYLVPCHRVVASNGGLGGFSGGLAIKKKLLKAEGYL